MVVGVDPAVTSKEGSDDTGIIVAGKGTDGHGYVLGDYTVHDIPRKWAEAAITAYNRHEANIVVGGVNNGGDLVEMNIKAVDTSIPFKSVHASRGKATRAEPISALYEQNRVHHFGNFPQLEDQMVEWIPGSGKSPDRVDALTWTLATLDLNSYAEWDNFLSEGSSFASFLDDGGEDTWSQWDSVTIKIHIREWDSD